MKKDLSQADLSHLALNQMTAEERAEVKRRFETFVASFMPRTPVPEFAPARRVRKWVPGMKS